jgi:hypothetical protein
VGYRWDPAGSDEPPTVPRGEVDDGAVEAGGDVGEAEPVR